MRARGDGRVDPGGLAEGVALVVLVEDADGEDLGARGGAFDPDAVARARSDDPGDVRPVPVLVVRRLIAVDDVRPADDGAGEVGMCEVHAAVEDSDEGVGPDADLVRLARLDRVEVPLLAAQRIGGARVGRGAGEDGEQRRARAQARCARCDRRRAAARFANRCAPPLSTRFGAGPGNLACPRFGHGRRASR